MLSLASCCRAAVAASAGLIAVCGFLIVDDELHARKTRADLVNFWLPARTMNRALLNAEQSVNSSLASHLQAPDDPDSASFDSALAHLQETLDGMSLAQGEARLMPMALASRDEARTWLAKTADAVRDPLPRAAKDALVNSGSALISSTRARLSALNAGAVQARQSLGHTDAVLRLTALIETLLLICLLALLILGLRFGVLSPLVRLREDLERSARHIAHAIKPSGPREISAVAHNAESMRRSLIQEQDASEHAAQALAQSSPLIVALHDELDRHDQEVGGIVGFHRPVEGVIAGDWWWAGADDSGRRMFAIADVSGHGVPAGLLALESRTLVTSGLMRGDRPDAICRQLAGRSFNPGMFLTLFIGVMREGSLDYCSAGHQEAAIVGVHRAEALPTTGPIISALGGRWQLGRAQITHDHVLVLATDGLLDKAPETSLATLAQSAWRRSASSPRELLQLLLADARERSDDWNDDVTLIIASMPGR